MTVSAAPVERPTLRLTTQTVSMLEVAALAWAGVIAYARHMGNAIGTMGMPLVDVIVPSLPSDPAPMTNM